MSRSPYALSNTCMLHIYINFITRIIIMLTIVLVLLELAGMNIFARLNKNVLLRAPLILILAISLTLVFMDRNYYLPFLGWSVYPCGSLPEKIPTNADTQVIIKVKPNSNVIFWASEPSNAEQQPISNPWDAYTNYENAGVVKSDMNGKATLSVRSPSSYRVGLMNRELKKHIHYRVCEYSGMLGPVQTLYV